MSSASRDITERAALEQALSEAEQRLRALQNSPVLGVVAGEGDQLLEANDAFLRMLGIERSDLERGLTWDEFALPEWAAADQHAFEVAVATGSPPVYEKEYLRPDGSRLPVLIASVLLDSRPTSWIAVVTDLSPLRVAEIELRRSEERYRSLCGGDDLDLRDPATGQHVGFVGTFHDITRRAAAEARLRSVAALTARLASANEVEDVGEATLRECCATSACTPEHCSSSTPTRARCGSSPRPACRRPRSTTGSASHSTTTPPPWTPCTHASCSCCATRPSSASAIRSSPRTSGATTCTPRSCCR